MSSPKHLRINLCSSYYAPYAAHAPFVPAPRHIDTWYPEQLPLSFNERDMSDKPSFLQDLEKQDPDEQKWIQQRQHEMLMSVDDGVSNILTALGDRVNNTLFVLVSDNGWLLGAHRLIGKDYPYAQATEVPMVVRFDREIVPGTYERLTLNIDLTATILSATGATLQGVEGKSFMDERRTGTVLEQTYTQPGTSAANPHPPYCGYRTKKWMFVHWAGQGGAGLLITLGIRPPTRQQFAGWCR